MRVSGQALWDGLFAPLNLAAYAIFGLIAFNQLDTSVQHVPASLLVLTLASFLAAYVVGELACSNGRRPRLRMGLLAIQATAAMANLALVFDGINPILLVLIAAQLPGFVSLPVALLVMALLDAVLFVLLRELHMQFRPLFNVAAYSTFQLFAMLTTWFAFRAEHANQLLAAANADLLATRSLLEQGARDGERLRLSRELHDVAGHTLTALQLHLELARRLPDQAQRMARVEAAQGLAEALLRDIRGVVTQLRRYDGIDLPCALRALCLGFPGIEIVLDIDPTVRVTDVERAESLLRVAQEALTNALRHGHAQRIQVRLQREGERVSLHVADDGRGAARVVEGNGLTGMRERLARFGGDLAIDTRPGHGLRLHARLHDPMPEAR